jgi:hypothetical protein
MFYIVTGFREGQPAGEWVIEATSGDEACCIAERRQAGVADFDRFEAEADVDGLFDAEENLSEEQE